MKTNNLYITLFAALAITACSKDNELPQGSAKDPNADMPDAYTSIAINIPHTTMTKVASGRAIDQGIADENKVKTLHVFIYDTDAPNTPTVAEFTVDDNSLAPKSPGSSTWVTNRAIKTKKADKYIFASGTSIQIWSTISQPMDSDHSVTINLPKKSRNWQI